MRPYNCNCFFETKTKQLEKRNEKLLEQNRELVEAKNAMVECSTELFRLLLKYCPPDDADFKAMKELLTKHSKDV